jgi:hypothetical protein
MKQFRKNLVERFVGKQFRTVTEVLNSAGTVCEACDVTSEEIASIYEFAEYVD